MMYAYKITIKRTPQKIRVHDKVDLPDTLLTLKFLSQYLKDENETFSIDEEEDGPFSTKSVLNIYGYRLETQEELKERVAKEEKYMENYYVFQAKYRKDK